MKYDLSWFACKIVIVIYLLSSSSIQTSKANNPTDEEFAKCFSQHIISNNTNSTKTLHSPNDPSYNSILYSRGNYRKLSSSTTLKPLHIITPSNTSDVQASILCARRCGLRIRTRSGGHDFEGASYISTLPFVLVDMKSLHSITVDVATQTAWVQTGANLGQIYYRIAEQSGTLGFPAGFCSTVGSGGHISGGGFGTLLRKYGLAADNIIDAYIVNVDGEVLDRASMGEDLFWAIRGGGGESFGIIVAWRIQLVVVPSRVTVWSADIRRDINESVKMYDTWQRVASEIDKDLFVFVILSAGGEGNNTKKTIKSRYSAVFLGRSDSLVALMQKSFPGLGVKKEDCLEMSWIDSVVYYNNDYVLNLTRQSLLDGNYSISYFTKSKVDYVKEPIPEAVLAQLLEKLCEEDDAGNIIQMIPGGGRMYEISESSIPFPHRAGFMYLIWYETVWNEEEETEKHVNWIRTSYDLLTPYVSRNPRASYINVRDLDLGTNNETGPTSYAQARIWGEKYFDRNFDRLVHVKTKVDPTDFFRNYQTIPPLSPSPTTSLVNESIFVTN